MSKKQSRKAPKLPVLRAYVKRVLLTMLALAVTGGAVKGARYVYAGMPHLQVGDCFHDKQSDLLGQVREIVDGHYHLMVLAPVSPLLPGVFLPVGVSMTIRDFNNTTDIELVSCKTGRPLNEKAKDSPDAGESTESSR